MNSSRPVGWLFLLMAAGCLAFPAVAAPAQASGEQIRVLNAQGTVELKQAGARTWAQIQSGQPLYPFDQVRTGPNSSATLRWSDSSVVQYRALTEIEILPAHAAGAQAGLHLLRGLFSFFHRDEPGRIRVISRGAVAGIEGTEFVMAVDTVNNVERTTLSVIEGRVGLTNDQGFVVLTSGQEAVAVEGQPPRRTAGFVANNLLQWAFYYPGVLDLRDLPLSTAEEQALADSRVAYRSGDLLDALAKYGARQPNSDAERIYQAALLLSVGEVTQSSNILAQIQNADTTARIPRLATSLQQLIAAVKRESVTTRDPELPTELLAASYYEQSRARGDVGLRNALALATRAATNSPDFGFAWARVAELEFSFGNTDKALDALNKSLAASPRNAQALALKGFLLAAQNKPRQAIEWFDQAITVDAALANAWLGRGLCRIRKGDSATGREDLLVAAAIEPRRAQLRSYVGKSFGDAGNKDRALHELELARNLDDADPTSWLYSALIKAGHNRINEAIGDLEKSQELNDNRSVYRSRFRLEEDRGVRSANLARIHKDAGMLDWSVFEASRAVSYDYANYSAHYFLANSYNELRDPNLINLRYETPSQAEFLLANLLSPVGAGILSPAVSQQEYSKLFERDRFGVISATEYLSRGAWTESGAQYGTFGNFSYSLEAFYRTDNGQRRNNDVEQRQLSLQVKQQLTPKDTVWFQVIDYEAGGGDLAQRFNESSAINGLRFEEKQKPIVALGYHREWSPGNHTLFLAARLQDTLSLTNPAQGTFLKITPSNSLVAVHGVDIRQGFKGKLEIYSAELQQIWQTGTHTTIIGGRFQWGKFPTENFQNDPQSLPIYFLTPAADQNLTVDFHRTSAYGYHFWQVLDSLQLMGGISYDRITFPENFRYAPISNQEETVEKVSPKAGLIWTPRRDTTARLAYTRSISGASLDQSYQLEPSQMAGFVESYRSIIPESVAGPNAGAEFETFGLSFEKKFPTRTYLGIGAELLRSEVHRTVGAFQFDNLTSEAGTSELREHLNFRERSLLASLSQLIDDEWAVGARYRLSDARLTDEFPAAQGLQSSPTFEARQKTESLLHRLNLFAIYNHRCGFFSQFDALWYRQGNERSGSDISSGDLWQFNAYLGYRFPRRNAVITVGLLNIADKGYHLNPLTTYIDLPRERTAVARLIISF